MVAPCGVYKKINIASRSKEIFEVFLLLKKYHKAFYGKYELAGKGVGQISRNRMGSFTGNLTKAEFDALRSQIATSNGKGGRRYRPYMFTEQGIAML
ncbi:MAG: ORF6N domain-containing protein, partial [Sphaerochaetaceae bacterium]|nr:ORF6N domain-containing protein [Sphaerochaetaceae bacterium]